MAVYKTVVGVDDLKNFPPAVRQAIADSAELKAAYLQVPPAGAATGTVPTKQSDGSIAYVVPSGQQFAPQLPTLELNTTNATPITTTTTYIAGTYTMRGFGKNILATGTMTIRGRGNYTWSLPKKPYKLKLDTKAPLLGMPSAKSWALLANYDDKSQVNTTIAYTLGKAGTQQVWIPRSDYCEVILNGVFIGIYQLTEDVRFDTDRIPAIAAPATTGLGLTGAYLMEIDQRGLAAGELGWTTPQGVAVLYDDPDGTEPIRANYIQTWVNTFENSLYATTWLDPAVGYSQYVDMVAFADWYLMQELASNQDSGFYSSCKLWKSVDTATAPGVLRMGPLWDFGLAWGLVINELHPSNAFYTLNGAKWLARMMGDPAFVTVLKTRWNSIKTALVVGGTGDVYATIDATFSKVADALLRDQQAWSYTPQPRPLLSATKKKWITERVAFMDTQFAAPADTVTDLVYATL